MMLVRTYLDRSAIHGIGVFAAEPIKAGTQVWGRDPVIDLAISAEEISQLPEAARADATARAFVDNDGDMILSRDNAVFFNHSDEPNCSFNCALRDIAAHEELTEDYRAFGRGACNEFLFGAEP